MTFSKGFLASAVLTLAATSASAQDWNGMFYGGAISFGSGSYDQGVSSVNEIGPTVDIEKLMIGIRGGYNVQTGTTVYGFDADLSTGPDGIVPSGTSTAPDWNCVSGDCNVSIDALLTLRGRYGVLTDPKTLVYGAAGLAVGKIDGGIFDSVQQGSSTAVGYTLGLGVEHKTSTKASVFGELNYVDLGTLDFGEGSSPAEVYDAKGDFLTLKIGMNFRF